MTRKPIFDTVRTMLGRGFTPTEVKALDAAIDAALTSVESRTISPEGIALVKRFEGCAKKRPDGRIEAYPDPGTGGAPWTIGWGHTGPEVKPGTIWTQAQADEQLEHDLARFEAAVAKLTGGVTAQGQYDALVSFAYNVGEEALRTSTLLRKHNEGDYAGAAGEFAKWTFAAGKKLPGLVKRRAAEAARYQS